jgi:netrin-G3 ligand
MQEELSLAEYTIRTFSLQTDTSKTERIVTQYHFTIWPDHGVPDYPTALLQFVRRVVSASNEEKAPIVVHCSAGVGRTGTFITLFSQLQRVKSEENIDIFNFVRSMRYNRCCMVQTEVRIEERGRREKEKWIKG